MRARVSGTVLILVVVTATAGRAQRPGEIVGTVVDAATARGVAGVDIRLPALQRTTITDAAGHFALRGIEPGEWTLYADRLGFVAREATVTIRNGQTAHITIRVVPAPIVLEGVRAEATRAAGTRIDRAALERSGARTAGDALRDVAGVVLRSTGPGSPQTVSLRGMPPDAVLVLVDGVPLNDPVTGEADLSLIDASSIASMTVLPGAQSARWGPRAAAGVIRIATRRAADTDRRIEIGIGSLGARDVALAWGNGTGLLWNAGMAARRLDGAYAFALPDALGGAMRRRENADLASIDLHAGTSVHIMGGRLDARAGHDALERGLPGRGFAPSRHARQESDRSRASLHWRRAWTESSLAILLAGSHQRLTHADSAPPFGVPYTDTTDVTHVEARIDAERAIAGESVVGAGIELRHQHIGGTVLDADAPDAQRDAGVFAHAAVPLYRLGGESLRLAAQVRLDRDPVDHGIIASHSVTLSWARTDVGLYIAHRSSYSPATPGDRFFRDALGIEPNPDLRAERVPGEIEVGANAAASAGGWVVSARAAAYRGDIDGMILWAPDFRFVWSPYNQDVKRAGGDVSLELLAPRGIARVAGSWSFVRSTYDRGHADDDVQIAYRPRHSAIVDGALVLGATRLITTLRRTGSRTTAPTTLNTLPAFWTLDAAISHARSVGGWSIGLDVRVDRVFDHDGALIFGFPEPGRTVRFGVRVTPDPTPILLSIGSSQ